MSGASTVTRHSAARLPSGVAILMVEEPIPVPVTLPNASTVAASGLLEVHTTVLSTAVIGDKVGRSATVSPLTIEKAVRSSAIPVRPAYSSNTISSIHSFPFPVSKKGSITSFVALAGIVRSTCCILQSCVPVILGEEGPSPTLAVL
ncbi:hypothetical protein D3C76_431800 [compost metagenome]